MKRGEAKSTDRHIAVYDGQRRLGSISGHVQKYIATDAADVDLGIFATVAHAANAISSAANASGVEQRDNG